MSSSCRTRRDAARVRVRWRGLTRASFAGWILRVPAVVVPDSVAQTLAAGSATVPWWLPGTDARIEESESVASEAPGCIDHGGRPAEPPAIDPWLYRNGTWR